MKNPIKFLVSIVFMLVISTVTVFAQWAGPDQTIIRNQSMTQIVTLSVVSADPNACYQWTGPNIAGDANQPTVMATPEDSVQTYICKRYDQMGVAEDDVIVRIKDSVTIVSVKPLQECYELGGAVTTDQFEIVTDPVGYENQVTVQPTTIQDNGLFVGGNGKANVDLTFSLTVNGNTSTKHQNVTAINPDQEVSVSVEVNVHEFCLNIYKFENTLKEYADITEKVKKADGLAKLGAGFSKDGPNVHLGGITLNSFKYKCCNNKVGWVLPFSWSGGWVDFGVNITFPFPIAAIPGVSFYLQAYANAKLSVGPYNVELSRELACASYQLPVTLTGTVGGAAGVCFLAPSVLSAQLAVEGEASIGLTATVIPKMDIIKNPLTLKASVVGKVTAMGLYTSQVSWTFAEWVL